MFSGMIRAVRLRMLHWLGGVEPHDDAPSDTPKLDKALAIIKEQVILQAKQEGGPDLVPTMELRMNCTDDAILREVLTIKGGRLGIVIHLIPDLTPDLEHAAAMAQLREACGINQGQFGAPLPGWVPPKDLDLSHVTDEQVERIEQKIEARNRGE